MLLPPPDHAIPPGSISLPYETSNPNSLNRQLKRSMRQMRGLAAYELTIDGSEERATFLANFAGLSRDDLGYEERVSGALDVLLSSIMDAIDEAASHYEDKDQPILKTVVARSLKDTLQGAISVAMEDADAQLADIRRENAA